MSLIVLAPRRLSFAALCAAGLLIHAGCSSTPTATGDADAAGPAATEEKVYPEVTPVAQADANRDVVPVEGAIPLSPPDGKWLTDEYGRKYFVHRINKVPDSWMWVEEGKRVQLIRGLMFDVVSYDDNSFDVKIYGTDANMAAAIDANKRRGPTPEALAQAAATYVPSVRAADRLLFSPFSQGLPQTGQWRQGFEVADINQDGQLDIVHGPPRKGGSTPALILGDGKGGWRRWREATFPAVNFDYGDVAVADFNGDQHPDLAIASHQLGITAMVGDGKGGFSLWSDGVEFGTGDQGQPIFTSRAITAVDWNRDGRPDLLAWGEGPRIAANPGQGGAFSGGSRGAVIYLNQGDGTWQKRAQADGDRGYGDAVSVADFNNDGRPDFAAASVVSGTRTILYTNQEDGSWKAAAIDQLRPQATFRSVAVGDFDRDGQADLAVGYSAYELGVARTGVDVLLARPGGWERRPLGVEEGRAGIWALGAGDLDGDGALDLVGITRSGNAWVFTGDGKGFFAREESPELDRDADGCAGYHVELVDLDGDGAAEVLVGYAGESQLTIVGTRTECGSGGALRVWKGSAKGSH